MKVGDIMTRHNNSNVAVASVYDEKFVPESNIFPPTVFADDSTVFLLRTNQSGNVVLEKGVSYQINNPTYSAVETLSLNNNHDVYALHISSTSTVTCTFDAINSKTADAVTVDGVFYVPVAANANTGNVILFRTTSTPLFNIQLNYSSEKGFFTLQGLFNPALSYSAYAPFHLAWVLTKSGSSYLETLFVNGVKAGSQSKNNFINHSTCDIGRTDTAAYKKYNNIYCAYYRISTCARWTDNFNCSVNSFVYSFNKGNYMAIRHNGKTYYVPLVTAASPPCIAVRRNNQTFYTLGG